MSEGTIDKANKNAVEKILSSQAILVDVQPAIKVVPGMRSDTIFHAGPPIGWKRMCGPMRGAIMGAIIFEGLADTPKKAAHLVETGEIQVTDPCHQHQSAGPMCGVTSPSMPVWVIENKVHGNRGYSYVTADELTFGAYDKKVIEQLYWIKKTLSPVLKAAVKESGGIDLKTIFAKALQMGDECHLRFLASNSIFARELIPHLCSTGFGKDILQEVGKFLAISEHEWLCGYLMMAACKTMMDPAMGIKDSTIVVAMARNGVDFGIRVSGLGEQWFTAPSNRIKGFFYPPYKEEDANPDLGDSAISETRGLGGNAIAAAPVLVKGFGLTFKDALDHTKEMFEICATKDNNFFIPTMDFIGTPVGIDIRKVVETGIVPIIDTGIAHKDPGHRIIGTGRAEAPIECFKKALHTFARKFY